MQKKQSEFDTNGYIEYHKAYEEGKRKANYNLNPYPIGSKEYVAFNQGVCGVLDHTNV